MQTDLIYWYNLVLDNYGCIQKDENCRVHLHRFLTLEQSASRSSHFILRGETPVLIGIKVVWAPASFWKFWKREVSFAPARFRIAYTRIPARSPVAISAQREKY